jgi:oligopeptide/dipeptide ABC transporter ATP-binding protein
MTDTQYPQQQPTEEVMSVQELSVTLKSNQGDVTIVHDLTFDLHKSKTLALVGESGCGKTMAMLALMGLIPTQQVAKIGGQVLLQGQSLLTLSPTQRRSVCGNRIAMVFQEPMSALNPTMTIGEQVAEPLIVHKKIPHSQAMQRAETLLAETGIEQPKRRLRQYPFEFSGGMLQRVMIAMALTCEPAVIIADEPTTALDVTTQRQVLGLFKQLQQTHGTALLLITHDLGVVAHMADQVGVMYAGRLVEYGDIEQVFGETAHPYTQALKASTPDLQLRGQRLIAMEGQTPPAGKIISGCAFAGRCAQAMKLCAEREVPWIDLSSNHGLHCWLYQQDNPHRQRNR